MSLRTDRRLEIINRLGGKCKGCGSPKPNVSLKSGLPVRPIMENEKLLQKHRRDFILLCTRCATLASRKRRGEKVSFHGSYSFYRNKGCRCQLCIIAHTNYMHGRNSVTVELMEDL